MSYKRVKVEPEIALEYKGTTVYHAYNDFDFEDCLTFWFSMNKDDEEDRFDVRELDTYNLKNPDTIVALKQAIDAGLLENKNSESYSTKI